MKTIKTFFTAFFLSILIINSFGCTNESLTAERYIYKTVEGKELDLYIQFPQEKSENMPCILFFHGGGYKSGDAKDMLNSKIKFFASLGMVAVSANYRLMSDGKSYPPDSIEDGKSAYAWIVKNAEELGVDKKKIILAGSSAGGHLCLSVYLCEQNTLLSDIPFLIKPAGFILYSSGLNPIDWQKVIDNNHLQIDLDDYNPIKLLKEETPPILCFHSKTDETVSYNDALLFSQRADTLGIDFTLISYESGGHNFHSNKEYTKDINEKCEEFLIKNEIII